MTSRIRRFGVAEPARPMTRRTRPSQLATAPEELPYRNRPAAVALSSLLLIVLVGSTFAANKAVATIQATPSSVAAGSTVTITGTNFARRMTVQLTWAGSTQSMPNAVTNGSGRFTAVLTVPNVLAGEYMVGAEASASKTVTAGALASTTSVVATTELTVVDTATPGPTFTDSAPTGGSDPTASPTTSPETPTFVPSAAPATADPTQYPFGTLDPTAGSSVDPTAGPTLDPTTTPTFGPSATPTLGPSATPTARPTATPTARPTATPTATPTSTPRPTATPTAPPSTGIPPIPAGYGSKFRKDFSDGKLGPFHPLTFNNDHPGQLMTQYCDYVSDSAHISVHNGYLDLRATPTSGGRWDCSLVGTWTVGGLPIPVYKWQYGTSRVMARLNSGPGVWQGTWNWAADCWCDDEIDWLEQTGTGRFTANVHGSSNDGQKVSIAPLSGWHEYGTVRTPSYIAFTLDGKEIGRTNVSMSANLTLNADAKVGLAPPTSATPDSVYLQIAWWTVD